jgi:DNA-binding PadR family transcriptional regulator
MIVVCFMCGVKLENTGQYLILGMLSNKPMTGYDIHKRVKTRMSFWDISYGQIYPTLRRLEEEGSLKKIVEINEDSPNRKVYSITDKGTKNLQKWLMKPAKPEKMKIETLLKVGFGEQIPKSTVISHIEESKARNVSALKIALSYEKELKANSNKSERDFFVLIAILLGKKFHEAAIEWADTAIKLIEEHMEEENR